MATPKHAENEESHCPNGRELVPIIGSLSSLELKQVCLIL
jgi:hypothetical protein